MLSATFEQFPPNSLILNNSEIAVLGKLSCSKRIDNPCYHSPQRRAFMRWNHYLAYFFGGAFLANTIPHFVNGVSGSAFQSPFASPPGIGLSSSIVNVLWGLFNLAIAYLLICRVGSFDLRKTQHVLVLGGGILIMSLMLARTFGKLHGGL
jgi:hypothetical protein